MDIKKGNQEFLNILDNNKELKDRRDELVKGQHPDTLVITCSDSRVIPEYIFNATLGELFVIRTAGNVINAGELATVEYAIEHLKVKNIIVLGHTHCGAIHASIHNEKGIYLDPILNRIKSNIGDICNELEASKINALKEVDYLKEKFPTYKGTILAMIYDIETSKVISL
jgi:carbonic anhydrase